LLSFALFAVYLWVQVRALNAKFPVEERDTASIIIDHSGPPPDMYDVQVREMSIIEDCGDSGQISISVEDPQLFFSGSGPFSFLQVKKLLLNLCMVLMLSH
jgi:hypothetical protein